MKKQKTAKRAFISSLISLALCVTMLVGTTFAWYTDSVTSGRNTIVSGSLDMVIERYKGTDGDFSNAANWETVTADTKIFKEVDNKLTFEPGAVQVAYVRVSNNGDLAFKYSLAAKVFSETKGRNQAGVQYKLSDYLKFGTATVTVPFATREDAIAAVPNAAKLQDATLSANGAKLEKGADPVIVALVVYMPSDVGNDANPKPDEKPEISFGLNALATQATIENDSFSTDYDASAEYEIHVDNAEDFKAAIISTVDQTVILSGDVQISTTFSMNNAAIGDKTLDLNGHTLNITFGTTACTVSDGNALVIKDSAGTGKIQMQRSAPGAGGLAIAFKVSGAGSSLIIDGVDINVTASKGTTPSAIALDAYNGATLTVNSGSVTCDDIAIRAQSGNASAVINGGTVTGATAGVQAGATGNVTINGGTITGTESAVKFGGANTTVTITGGTITGTNGYAVDFTTAGTGNKVLNISGGTLTGGTGEINNTQGNPVNDTRA